jgi:hypothetical protein
LSIRIPRCVLFNRSIVDGFRNADASRVGREFL